MTVYNALLYSKVDISIATEQVQRIMFQFEISLLLFIEQNLT